MAKQEEMISRAEAVKAVALTCRRLGMLHIAFAATLVKEFGQEKGEELTSRAIKEYARMIGEKKKENAIKQGMEPTVENFRKLGDLPSLGMHDKHEEVVVNGEKRNRAWGCVMGKTWHEYGQDRLGRIYCYVDPASTMTFSNQELKMVHTKALPDGDEYCELCFRPTTEQDKKDFKSNNTDFRTIEERTSDKPKSKK